MKVVLVGLWLLNFDGGAPHLVQNFPDMETCMASARGVQSNLGKIHLPARLLCIPIMQKV